MVFVWLLWACGGNAIPEETGSEEDSGGGACGEVTTWTVEVRAAAVDPDGAPLSGIEIALEERNWAPGILGAGVTGVDGTATFTAAEVTGVEGCWGTALDYWLVAVDPAGVWADAEDGVNSALYGVIEDGSLDLDLTERPLPMEPAR